MLYNPAVKVDDCWFFYFCIYLQKLYELFNHFVKIQTLNPKEVLIVSNTNPTSDPRKTLLLLLL